MKLDIAELMRQRALLNSCQENLTTLSAKINAELDNVCNNVKSASLVQANDRLKESMASSLNTLNVQIDKTNEFMGTQLNSYQNTNQNATTALQSLINTIGDVCGNYGAQASAGIVAGATAGVAAVTQTKSNDEIIQEVINGKWGNGDERKERLAAAGYNVEEIQAGVNSATVTYKSSGASSSSSSSGGTSSSSGSTSSSSGYTPSVTNSKYSGQVLTRSAGRIEGPSGQETYYNLNMSGVIKLCKNSGISLPGEYWVRSDGVKMLGDYVMVAANLDVHPRGSYVDTSLGKGIVVDTGGFAKNNPTQLDIAVSW